MTQWEDQNFLLVFNLSLINYSGQGGWGEEGGGESNSEIHESSALVMRGTWLRRASSGWQCGCGKHGKSLD